jgi:hypothetical protein
VVLVRKRTIPTEGTAQNIASSKSVSEGEGDGMPAPSEDRRGAAGAREEIPPNIKSTSADQRTSLKGTWSDKKERANEDGMKTDTLPSK